MRRTLAILGTLAILQLLPFGVHYFYPADAVDTCKILHEVFRKPDGGECLTLAVRGPTAALAPAKAPTTEPAAPTPAKAPTTEPAALAPAKVPATEPAAPAPAIPERAPSVAAGAWAASQQVQGKIVKLDRAKHEITLQPAIVLYRLYHDKTFDTLKVGEQLTFKVEQINGVPRIIQLSTSLAAKPDRKQHHHRRKRKLARDR
jgi:hypothetical protein